MGSMTALPARSGSTSATDLAFDTLLKAIVSLKLPPGSKVSELEIATQLEMSRQPVRDAFFRLSKLGLILIRPQRATLIAKISQRAVADAVFIRTAVEVECLRALGAGLAPSDVSQLRGIIHDQREVKDLDDREPFHRHDDRFHAALCLLAGQARAWDLIQEQKAHMDRVRFLTLVTDRRLGVLTEHDAILDSLASGDLVAAEANLRRHLGDILSVLPKLRRTHSEFFDADLDAGSASSTDEVRQGQ